MTSYLRREVPTHSVNNNDVSTHLNHLQENTSWLYGMDMMTSSDRNIFRLTGHLCGEFTGQRWIPRTKASDA